VKPTAQEYPNIPWKPKVHHRVHNSPPPVHNLSQINPVHTTPSSLDWQITIAVDTVLYECLLLSFSSAEFHAMSSTVLFTSSRVYCRDDRDDTIYGLVFLVISLLLAPITYMYSSFPPLLLSSSTLA
jgi:hypothetical protein